MKIKNEYVLFAIFLFILLFSFVMNQYSHYFSSLPLLLTKAISGILYSSLLFYLYKIFKTPSKTPNTPKTKTETFLFFVPPVVFSIYPIIHIYLLNTEEITLKMFIHACLSLILLCTILIGIFYITYKDIIKSSITTSVIIFIFYQYLNITVHFDNAVFWCILLVTGIIIFKIETKQLFKIFLVLSTILCFFSIFDTANFLYNTLINKPKNLAKELVQEQKISTLKKPDIYIILLDAYPSNEVLKRDFDFDNTEFTTYLEKKNFLVFKSIYSNYSKTICSLPSFLNHKYVDTTNKTPSEAISQAELFKNAYKNGYKLNFINSFGGFKLQKGFISSVKDISGHYSGTGTTINQAFFYGTFFQKIFPFFNNRKSVEDIFWPYLRKETEIKSPKLVFAHVMAPHLPYLKDKNGETINTKKRDDILIDEKTKEYKINKQSCLEYLIYTNSQTQKAVDNILRTTNNNAYIIILGDHGLRLHYYSKNEDKNLYFLLNEKNTMNSFFNTFLAFYSPKQNYSEYKDSRTLMNFFINFSNDVFNTNYKKQNDKFYFVYFNQNKDLLRKIHRNTKQLTEKQIHYTK